MVLQAFIDDSGEADDPCDDPAFVLAGFIADTTQWEAFSDEWKAALSADPKIDYFKMREAANLSADGQFARRLGWDEASRDAKVNLLAAIIPRHVQARVSCSINKDAFVRFARSLPVLNRSSVIDKPYCMAFQNIIMTTAAVFKTYEVHTSCDFIFDEQGQIGEDAVRMWDNLMILNKKAAGEGRADFGPFLGQRPVFRDDKIFLPLQAADLYAWNVRRGLTDNRVLYMPPRGVMKILGEVATNIARHISERELVDFRNSMDRGASELFALNPALKEKLVPYKGSKAQQKRERVKARAAKKKPGTE